MRWLHAWPAHLGWAAAPTFHERETPMTTKIGITGFGRMVLRAAVHNFRDVEIGGIKHLFEPEYLACMRNTTAYMADSKAASRWTARPWWSTASASA
jgi:hypothetical protein